MKKALVSILSLAMVLSWSHQAGRPRLGSNSLNDQLIQAAKTGDTAAVRQVAGPGRNIEAKEDYEGKRR